jgi:hypothetical protein
MIDQCRQYDAAYLLESVEAQRTVAAKLEACRAGKCGVCGDVCAIKGRLWTDANLPTILKLINSQQSKPIFDVRITRERWARSSDDLASIPSVGVEKAIRRALDALYQPATIAIGMMDAWYGRTQWDVGVRFLIAGPAKTQIYDPSGVRGLIFARCLRWRL